MEDGVAEAPAMEDAFAGPPATCETAASEAHLRARVSCLVSFVLCLVLSYVLSCVPCLVSCVLCPVFYVLCPVLCLVP